MGILRGPQRVGGFRAPLFCLSCPTFSPRTTVKLGLAPCPPVSLLTWLCLGCRCAHTLRGRPGYILQGGYLVRQPGICADQFTPEAYLVFRAGNTVALASGASFSSLRQLLGSARFSALGILPTWHNTCPACGYGRPGPPSWRPALGCPSQRA